MPTGKVSQGVHIRWSAEQKDKDGNLIVRMADLAPPDPPTCIRPSCLFRYIVDSITFSLVAMYETRRVKYASINRSKKILERYRTGEPMPQNLWQAIHANIKLTCPLCRKYNYDPLLFRRKKWLKHKNRQT